MFSLLFMLLFFSLFINLFPALSCSSVMFLGFSLINVLSFELKTIRFIFKSIIMFKQFWQGAESCKLFLLSHLTTYIVVFFRSFLTSSRFLFLFVIFELFLTDFYTISVFSRCIR